MRKWRKFTNPEVLPGVLVALLWTACPACALAQSTAPGPSSPYSAFSDSLLERAKAEVIRVKALVKQGTLAKSKLDEAEEQLADAEDEAILAHTLYAPEHLENTTEAQAAQMVAAAGRRVDRQSKRVEQNQKLLDLGILARSEVSGSSDELASRRRVLDLANNRVTLIEQLRQMAAAEERRLDVKASSGGISQDVEVRFDGGGKFALAEMASIASAFELQFHHALPISATGQTALHRSMGLDHRDRVDVALNPDAAEGLWLRRLLERRRDPYLAFRSAVAGAATAPHIHIGPGSTRLKAAQR
jgi:hypothetical protein